VKSQAIAIVTGIILLGMGLVAVSVVLQGRMHPAVPLFWILLCVTSELFWSRTVLGDSVHSLAAPTKLSAIFILGPWPALPVIWISTLAGNLLFRRSAWYKALYNASQLTVTGAAAGLVYLGAGGRTLLSEVERNPLVGPPDITRILAGSGFLTAFLLAGLAYIVVNSTLMAWLMSTVTGRRLHLVWQENCLYPEEIQSNAALVLLSPLLMLLYGAMGVVGLIVLFATLGLVLVATQRYVALVKAQDSLVRGERMAAMGDMAEEIGDTLGKNLEDLKQRTSALLVRSGSLADEKLQKSVDIIHENVGRMSALIEGLAAFSHRETLRAPTDLNELLRRTIEFVRPQNRFDGIEFAVALAGDLPPADVDAGQIQQVFINLFANAADAMQDSPVRRVEVASGFDSKTSRVRVTVRDTGPGIPKDSLPRIFDPHFTTKPTGHGFGLSTAFRIVENHQGSIQASNLTSTEGAEFLIELPAA